MKKSFKCSNGHRFRSEEAAPACPQCGEPGSAIEWKEVGEFPKDTPVARKLGSAIGNAINHSVDAVKSTLSMSGPVLPESKADGDLQAGKVRKSGG